MTIVEELRTDRESGARRLESEYKAGLMSLARRFCADEGDAEELVNRTLAAVVEGIDDYLEQSAFFGWMCKILENLHAKDVRRKSSRTVAGDTVAVEGACDDDACDRIFREVDASLLRDAISDLPADMKESVVLRYFMDLPVAKIARFLAIPEGTVMWRLHCARKILAAKLGATTRRPGARLVLLALLLAAGLAAGRALYTLGTAVLETRAESAQLESHAESAESVSHAESAESVSHAENAESVSHAENAESVFHAENAESAEIVSHAENAESAEPTPSTPSTSSTPSTVSTPDSSEMNAYSLLAASASLALAAAPAPVLAADAAISYTGAFSVADHPSIEGAKVVTLTSSGTLTVSEDLRLLRLLVVGGGGGGGFGGGAGGQAVDWAPETPVYLKSDDRYTAVVGYGGLRSYNTGSFECRGHNGYPSSFSGTSFSIEALGGGGGLAFNNGNGRWDPEEPADCGNGGGGAGGRDSSFSTDGSPAGADGCFRGGAATNTGSGATGCGGAGGGAGAGGNGQDSQVLHTTDQNDAFQDEDGNYEHAGDGGPGVASDITGETVFYGGGGGGGIRRSSYKHGGAGGAGGGGRGAGLHDGSFTASTAGTDGLGGGGGGGGNQAYNSNQSSSQGGRGAVILLVAPLAAGEEPADRESAWAVGGTVSAWRDSETKKNWVVHEFRGSGELVVKRGFDAELLLVGGGGSGGKGSASGGGAGGLVHTNGFHLSGGVYAVTVGAGGDCNAGRNGGDTSLVPEAGGASLVALGGGGGGGYWGKTPSKYPGLPGGSSGGSSWGAAAVDPLPGPDGALQGFPGGSAVSSSPDSECPGGSGGGGAGGPGGDGAKKVIGDGGPGLSFDITGETRWYAGGGGGGYSTSSEGNGRKGLGGSGIGGDGECAFQYTNFRRWVGHAGLDGTGSGGGGGGQGGSTGGRGGCGVLIVRYLADPPGTMILVK